MTTKQRLAVYLEALRLIQSGRIKFICSAISRAHYAMFERSVGYWQDIWRAYPELVKYRPKSIHDGDSWFPLTPAGKNRRIEVLNEIIETLEKL